MWFVVFFNLLLALIEGVHGHERENAEDMVCGSVSTTHTRSSFSGLERADVSIHC